jgi:hypothetical protein
MSQLRSLAHLEEQLGPARFRALLHPSNTGRVKALCDMLVLESSTLIVGNRTYDILSLIHDGEDSVSGEVFVGRAETTGASLDSEDCKYILDHQSDIPVVLRERAQFVFTNLRHHLDEEFVACVVWGGEFRSGDCWKVEWCRFRGPGYKSDNLSLILRRRPAERP